MEHQCILLRNLGSSGRVRGDPGFAGCCAAMGEEFHANCVEARIDGFWRTHPASARPGCAKRSGHAVGRGASAEIHCHQLRSVRCLVRVISSYKKFARCQQNYLTDNLYLYANISLIYAKPCDQIKVITLRNIVNLLKKCDYNCYLHLCNVNSFNCHCLFCSISVEGFFE